MILTPTSPPFIEFPVIGGLVVEISSESESCVVIAIPARIIAIMTRITTLFFVNMVYLGFLCL